MYDTDGELLREAWKAGGQDHCPHTNCSPERSFGGVSTGYSLCRTCGMRMTLLQLEAVGTAPTKTEKDHILRPMDTHMRSEWSHRRVNPRISISCPIMLERAGVKEGGRLLNVSVPGCGVEAPMSVNVGEYLGLRLLLSDKEAAIRVLRAIVRWKDHIRFGLEFLLWEDTDRQRLSHFIETGITVAA